MLQHRVGVHRASAPVMTNQRNHVPVATVTVNPSIDQHILIDELTKDDAIRAREIRRDPGGKGINVSRVVKELGGETAAFGVSGGCAGYKIGRASCRGR